VQPGGGRLVVAGAQVLDRQADLDADAGEVAVRPARRIEAPQGERPRGRSP
jgi:hypothetical protein